MARNHLKQMRRLRPMEDILRQQDEASVEQIDLDALEEETTYRYRIDLSVDSLADDIQRQGQLVPIMVRLQRGRYQLISGFRRVAALRQLGKKTVIARVFHQLSDEKALDICAAENLQREDLSPLEVAHIIKHYHEEGLSLRQIEERIALSKSAAKNYLDLLSCHPSIQQTLHQGKCSLSHALELRRCPEDHLSAALLALEKEDLSVRQLKQRIDHWLAPPSPPQRPSPYTPLVQKSLFFRDHPQGFDLKLHWRQDRPQDLPRIVSFLEEKLNELKKISSS